MSHERPEPGREPARWGAWFLPVSFSLLAWVVVASLGSVARPAVAQDDEGARADAVAAWDDYQAAEDLAHQAARDGEAREATQALYERRAEARERFERAFLECDWDGLDPAIEPELLAHGFWMVFSNAWDQGDRTLTAEAAADCLDAQSRSAPAPTNSLHVHLKLFARHALAMEPAARVEASERFVAWNRAKHDGLARWSRYFHALVSMSAGRPEAARAILADAPMAEVPERFPEYWEAHGELMMSATIRAMSVRAASSVALDDQHPITNSANFPLAAEGPVVWLDLAGRPHPSRLRELVASWSKWIEEQAEDAPALVLRLADVSRGDVDEELRETAADIVQTAAGTATARVAIVAGSEAAPSAKPGLDSSDFQMLVSTDGRVVFVAPLRPPSDSIEAIAMAAALETLR